MDVNAIANQASNMAAEKTQAAVATTVLRKALDLQQSSALTLLQALPAPSNPPNLGNRVDARA